MGRYWSILACTIGLTLWLALISLPGLRSADGATASGHAAGVGKALVPPRQLGAALFAEHACAGCHADDGSGGFGPSLGGADPATLGDHLRNPQSTHRGGRHLDLTDQDIARLSAFLAATPVPQADSIRPIAEIHVIDVAEAGILHGKGYGSPQTYCARCHGEDLSGGEAAPSCTSCHSELWEQD